MKTCTAPSSSAATYFPQRAELPDVELDLPAITERTRNTFALVSSKAST